MDPSKNYHVVPPDALRCVWMTAGILSYQLCDRSYECDDCPLDTGIRRHFRDQGKSPEVAPPRPAIAVSREELREGFRYSKNHCWVQEMGSGLMRVGIEPGLSTALLPPRSIVFPSGGQSMQVGQTCLWLVTEGGTFPIDSPAGGTVRRSNDRLVECPYLVHLQPFDEGWLFELETEEGGQERADLMDRNKAQSMYVRNESRLIAQLSNALHGSRPSVGITLADGGQRLQNIADLLGSTKYFSIVRRTYGL